MFIKRIGAYRYFRICDRRSVKLCNRLYLQIKSLAHGINKFSVISGFFDVSGNLRKSIVQVGCAVCFVIIRLVCGNFPQNIFHGRNGYISVMLQAEADGIHFCAKSGNLRHILVAAVIGCACFVNNSIHGSFVALNCFCPPVSVSVFVIEISVAAAYGIIRCALKPVVPKCFGRLS